MFHISFYRFVAVEDPVHLREHLLGLTAGLLGTILVAHEGVNGMLAGAGDELDAFEAALQAPDVLGGAFAGMAFTRTLCDVAPFRRRKIKVKAELVPLDVDGIDVPSRRADIAASDVDAAGWCALLRRDDVVVLDNRNSFEFGHGHFVGARNPGTVDFRDFAAFVRANAEEWRATGRTIAMYCTGGIRCEKSSPWMQDLGLTVRQLRGGIVTYLAETAASAGTPDTANTEQDWSGDCFVFDDRHLLNSRLQQIPHASSTDASDGAGEAS